MLRGFGRAKNKTALPGGGPGRRRARAKNAPAELICGPRQYDVGLRKRSRLEFPAWTDECGPGDCEWLLRWERGEQCPGDPKIGPRVGRCLCCDMARFARDLWGRTRP